MMETLTIQRLIRFESYAEIAQRPNFVPVLDTTAAVPETVVGTYHFIKVDQRKCGIRSCGTQHQRGFLIAMEAGHEVLVGNRCGRNKFGLAFKELVQGANRLDRIARDQSEIAAAILLVPALLGQVDAMLTREKGAKWLASRQADFRRVMPPESYHELGRRARRGELEIHGFRMMTGDEIEVAKATGRAGPDSKGPFIHRAVLATLEGIDIWDHDLRGLLVGDIQTGLKRLHTMTPQQMSGTELRKQVAWIRDLTRKLEQAENLIGAGQKFFHPDNLQRLLKLEVKGDPIKGMYEGLRELTRPPPVPKDARRNRGLQGEKAC
jgi:hypothetical protein